MNRTGNIIIMSRDEQEIRLDSVEKAIVELTVLNRAQVENAKTQSASVTSILEAIKNLGVTQSSVENNTSNIKSLNTKVDDLHLLVMSREDTLASRIADNKEELKSLGSNRLLQSITMATVIASGMFGYVYLKVEDNTAMFRSVQEKVDHVKEVHLKNHGFTSQSLAIIRQDLNYFKERAKKADNNNK